MKIQYADKVLGAQFSFGDANEIKNSVNLLWDKSVLSTDTDTSISGLFIGADGKIRAATANEIGLAAGLVPLATSGSATDITSGTLNDARLSSNVPLKNAASNIFTGAMTVSGDLTTSQKIILGLNSFIQSDGTGAMKYETSFAGTANFKSLQSGQSFRLNLVTAEPKSAGLWHYDLGNAKGRLLEVFSEPGVAIALVPGNTELLRATSFGGNVITSTGTWTHNGGLLIQNANSASSVSIPAPVNAGFSRVIRIDQPNCRIALENSNSDPGLVISRTDFANPRSVINSAGTGPQNQLALQVNSTTQLLLSETSARFSGTVQVGGASGPLLKNSSGVLQFRDSTDSAFYDVRALKYFVGTNNLQISQNNFSVTLPRAEIGDFLAVGTAVLNDRRINLLPSSVNGFGVCVVANAGQVAAPYVYLSTTGSALSSLNADGGATFTGPVSVGSISVGGILTLANNAWHRSVDTLNRFYFTTSSTTYLQGHGTSPFIFRNGTASDIFRLSSTGALGLGSLQGLWLSDDGTTSYVADGTISSRRLSLYTNGGAWSQSLTFSAANAITAASGQAVSSVFTFSGSSGNQANMVLDSLYTQTGTTGSRDLWLRRTETSLGSGSHVFIDATVNGASRFSVTNAGNVLGTGISSREATATPLGYSTTIAYWGRGSAGLYGTSSGDGSQLYLGDSNFTSSAYWNSAPGIGAVGGSPTSELAFYVYTGVINSRSEAGRFKTNFGLQLGGTSGNIFRSSGNSMLVRNNTDTDRANVIAAGFFGNTITRDTDGALSVDSPGATGTIQFRVNSTYITALNITSDAKVQFRNGNWHGSVDGLDRQFFVASGPTYYKGHGAGIIYEWRDGNDAARMTMGAGGQLTLTGNRPIVFTPGAGTMSIQASTGGWSNDLRFLGSGGTHLTGFGANGTNDTLNNAFIGVFGAEIARFVPGGLVSINMATQSGRSLSINPQNTGDRTGVRIYDYGSFVSNNLQSGFEVAYVGGTVSAPTTTVAGDYRNILTFRTGGSSGTLVTVPSFAVRCTIGSTIGTTLSEVNTSFLVTPTSTGTPITAMTLFGQTGLVNIDQGSLQLGTSVRLKNSGDRLFVRNGTDTAFAELRSLRSMVYTGIHFNDQTTELEHWFQYKLASDPRLYIRDSINSRMQVTYTAGVSASAASTQFHSKVIADDVIQVGGASGPLLKNSSGVIQVKNSADTAFAQAQASWMNVTSGLAVLDSTTLTQHWLLYKNAGDPNLYLRDPINARQHVTFSAGTSADTAATTISSQLTVSGAAFFTNTTPAMMQLGWRLSGRTGGTESWRVAPDGADAILMTIRDMVSSRNQITLSRGSTPAAASTQFHSRLIVDDTITAAKSITITGANDPAHGLRLYNSSSTLNPLWQISVGYPGFYDNQLIFHIDNSVIFQILSNQVISRQSFNCLGSLSVTGATTLSSTLSVTSHVTSAFQTLAANPTTLDIPAGSHRVVKNTTSGEIRNWVNDGGVMKSSAAYA